MTTSQLLLNTRAAALLQTARCRAAELRISAAETAGAEVLDFGVSAEGGLEAGLLLARICLADLADVRLIPAAGELPLPQVWVRTDHPVPACLCSQYAGWKIQTDDYFAMGSGPMRAMARTEELFAELPETEASAAGHDKAVGVLEAGQLPHAAAVDSIRSQLPEACRLHLAVARTASQAGNIQVVARSVETALHKLHSLHFPLDVLISGTGSAPLPPTAKHDLQGIGRTNDAILYGATVNLWVRCEDDLITAVGPRVPSGSSAAHGQTFLSLFKAANHDFYAMDAALFSPAVVVFHNVRTGRSFQFGQHLPQLLRESFGI